MGGFLCPLGPGHKVGTNPCLRRTAPGEMPRQPTQRPVPAPRAVPRAQDTTRTPRQGTGWGQLSHHIPKRCFPDLLHRHGFETKDAVEPENNKPGAPLYFSSWTKVVGLNQPPETGYWGADAVLFSMSLFTLPPPSKSLPSPNSHSRGLLCLLSLPVFPRDVGLSCRLPRSSNPTPAKKQFRMHREEEERGEREK